MQADPDPRAPLVAFAGLTRIYGEGEAAVVALDAIDLTIARGEFTAFMGASGSGKSTAMNIMGCLDVPTRGSYRFAGVPVEALSRAERALLRRHYLGFVFQGFNLIPSLTAGENIGWPLEFSGLTRADAKRRTACVLERVGVPGREQRYPAELSGGEQQRVAIARAIATEPKLILADEPTGNLDSHTGRLILDLLRELNVEDGVTVVLVTHNMFAASYGDRTLELRDGRIVRDVASPQGTASARDT